MYLENSVDIIRKTFLKCLAIFLVYFVTIFAIGLGILAIIKLFEIWFL